MIIALDPVLDQLSLCPFSLDPSVNSKYGIAMSAH